MSRSLRVGGVAIGLIGSLFLLASCADQRATSPRAASASIVPMGGGPVIASAQLPDVRFSEIHYDNTGTDAGEAIEISGPAGMNVQGWTVVLYNGNGGASYSPLQTLSGTIPATCGDRGVIVLNYAVNGIQNGDPDGMALVDAAGQVIEFLSYEGTFAATNGPAVGMTSTDIGVREAGTEAVGMSLQRSGGNVWSGPKANTFGTCNDNDTPPPPQVVTQVVVAPTAATITAGATQQFSAQALDASDAPVAGTAISWSSSDDLVASVNANGLATAHAAGEVTITARAPNNVAGTATLHVDPAGGMPTVRFSEIHYDNAGVDEGEAIEIEGPAGTSLSGWSVVLYDGTGGTVYNTTSLSGTIPASCDARGVVVLNYPTNGIQNGSPDGMALVNASGTVVEFLSYEGTFTPTVGPAAGLTSIDIMAQEASSSPIGQSLQRDGNNVWTLATSTFGACNGTTPPPPAKIITFSGRVPSDPALPVGFEDQLFATEKDGAATVTTTFTWSSETPDVATIDANGVFRARAAGSATFRATAEDGTTATYTLPTRVPTFSTTALYATNAEFGEPIGSNDFIGHRDEYTFSFNKTRNTPNWVAYEIDPTHFGPEDRCDCFTHDPLLPADYTHLNTNDYTGAGAAAGYGIDRGHLARSFDRTSAPGDNATTFYLSNIIPQAADLNQGPWANMENDLGNLVRNQGKEVYVIAGVIGAKGTLKNEGKVVIPEKVWKVAVVMPHDKGLADVHSVADLEVIAIIAPNDPGVRNVDWNTWRTTVDAVEAASGYDLLALLDDQIEIAIESNTKPPLAAVDGPFSSNEGSAVTMSGAGSTDPDGDALTYSWSFGDGSTGSGATTSHTYSQNGTYTVTLRVTDIRGLYDEVTTTTTVTNVAPTIGSIAGATLLPGETYSASGSFTDPGADAWTATVNYDDGGTPIPLALTGKSFSLSHTYGSAGTYTVVVTVTDDQVTSSRSTNVTVLTQAQGVRNIIALVDELPNANSLRVKLDAAAKQLDTGKPTPAANQLAAFLNELDAMARTGRMSPTDAEMLRQAVARVLVSLNR